MPATGIMPLAPPVGPVKGPAGVDASMTGVPGHVVGAASPVAAAAFACGDHQVPKAPLPPPRTLVAAMGNAMPKASTDGGLAAVAGSPGVGGWTGLTGQMAGPPPQKEAAELGRGDGAKGDDLSRATLKKSSPPPTVPAKAVTHAPGAKPEDSEDVMQAPPSSKYVGGPPSVAPRIGGESTAQWAKTMSKAGPVAATRAPGVEGGDKGLKSGAVVDGEHVWARTISKAASPITVAGTAVAKAAAPAPPNGSSATDAA